MNSSFFLRKRILLTLGVLLSLTSCLSGGNAPAPPLPKVVAPPNSLTLNNLVIDIPGASILRNIYYYDAAEKIQKEYHFVLNSTAANSQEYGRKYTSTQSGWTTERIYTQSPDSSPEYAITLKKDSDHRVSAINFRSETSISPEYAYTDFLIDYNEKGLPSKIASEMETAALAWTSEGNLNTLEVNDREGGKTKWTFEYKKPIANPQIFVHILRTYLIPSRGVLPMYRNLVGLPHQSTLPSGVRIEKENSTTFDLEVEYVWYEGNLLVVNLMNKGYREGDQRFSQGFFVYYNLEDGRK